MREVPDADGPVTGLPEIGPTSQLLAGDRHMLGPQIHVRSWNMLRSTIWPSIRFLLQTEVHVYSFAVAANILISFFPFLVAMISLCYSVLHWRAAVDIILQTLHDYFPENFGVNFRAYLLTAASHKFSWVSMFLLLFTANGIFVPLEVALNRIWHVKENRSFFRNQVVSVGLIFACGILVLINVSITTINAQFLSARLGQATGTRKFNRSSFGPLHFPLQASQSFWSTGCCRTSKSRSVACSPPLLRSPSCWRFRNT